MVMNALLSIGRDFEVELSEEGDVFCSSSEKVADCGGGEERDNEAKEMGNLYGGMLLREQTEKERKHTKDE